MDKLKKVKVRPSTDGQWFVEVVAENGEIVLTGETVHNREDAISTARKFAPPGALVQVFTAEDTLERDFYANMGGRA